MSHAAQCEASDDQRRGCVTASVNVHRTYAAGDLLYRQGERRRGVWRLERGTVALTSKEPGQSQPAVKLAGPGEMIGLGFLDHYTEGAQAVCEVRTRFLSQDEFRELLKSDTALCERQADAVAREFDYRKMQLSRGAVFTPLERLASFLISASRQNAYEGRDPTVITDSVTCGFVAELLGLDIDSLAEALLLMKQRGMIKVGDNGRIHLSDLQALEAIQSESAPDAGAC